MLIQTLTGAIQDGGGDITAELLSCGYIDVVVSALAAMEQVGADDVNGMVGTCGPLWALKAMAGEALDQIEHKIRAIPTVNSALYFCKEHPDICNSTGLGQNYGTIATIVAATLYGKDEDNAFGFARK